MTPTRRIQWVATVMCEGGPVMLTDLPDFRQWTGRMPFAELRAMSEKAGTVPPDRMRTLHYWGQFTDELPPPFAADGGHQYLTCASEEEALARLAELRRAVKEKFPAVEISEEDQQTYFLVSKGRLERQMWAELSPKSEYDASWQAHESEDSWVHDFGKSARGLFWEIQGGGVVDVGVSADGSEIVLLRSWIDGDEGEEEARTLVDAPSDKEEAAGEFSIASGKAVVVWSPVAPFYLTNVDDPDELDKLADADPPPDLDTEMFEGVGTIIRVKPGRWVVTRASTDDDDDAEDDDAEDDDEDEDEASFACRWLRLKWVGAS